VTGTKHDQGKRPWHLIPWDGLGPATDILRMGAEKYGARNWEQGIKYSRLFAATMRHLTAWWEGEDQDPESGLSPLAHALCDVLFLLAFTVRGRRDLDDRPEGDSLPEPETAPPKSCETCCWRTGRWCKKHNAPIHWPCSDWDPGE
jgi:hypothetical protein